MRIRLTAILPETEYVVAIVVVVLVSIRLIVVVVDCFVKGLEVGFFVNL